MAKTVTVDNKEYPTVEVEPKKSTEDWNEYELPGGDTLKVKLILTRIMKAEGAKDPNGEGIYNFEYQVIAKVVSK